MLVQQGPVMPDTTACKDRQHVYNTYLLQAVTQLKDLRGRRNVRSEHTKNQTELKNVIRVYKLRIVM